jgi:hypothetical protein
MTERPCLGESPEPAPDLAEENRALRRKVAQLTSEIAILEEILRRGTLELPAVGATRPRGRR